MNMSVVVLIIFCLFNVTKETIRSDLNTLAAMGLVQRCYGGSNYFAP